MALISGQALQELLTEKVRYQLPGRHRFNIASITKLYTAAAIMKLFEDKRISLDDPMSKYLPDELIKGIHKYKGKDYSKEINIRQLLSHKSGIADYYSEEAKNGKSLFDIFVEDPERLWTVDETINRARNDLRT